MEDTRKLNIPKGKRMQGQKGKSWLFAIGINEYRSFPNLHNAVKDAEDVVQLLKEKYDIDELVFISNTEATHDNIITQLDKLKRKIAPEDKLLIFYSGHGHLDSFKKGYWIPTDAEKDNTAHYIRNSTIRDYMEDIPALHTLLISDSCFSGSLFVRGVPRSDLALDELEKRKSRWALCSGRHDEEVYDGKPGENSPFTRGILNTLRRNDQLGLNVSRLSEEVMELTRANYKQLPEGNPVFGVGHDGGQYVFKLKENEPADWAYAQEVHTAEGYAAFLMNYPDGSFAKEAEKRRSRLSEIALWEKAEKENSVRAYDDYLDKYLNGRFSDEAQKRIVVLQEQKDWEAALRFKDLPSLRKYVRKYPQGPHVKEAFAMIEALREKGKIQERYAAELPYPAAPAPGTAPQGKSFSLPWLILGLVGIVFAGWLIVQYVIPAGNRGEVDHFPADIVFKEKHLDVGTMKAGETVAYVFHFQNIGTVPLEIRGIDTDPATTVASYPKSLIPPGRQGQIALSFRMLPELANEQGTETLVTSEILVYTNADYNPIALSITAMVEEAHAQEPAIKPEAKPAIKPEPKTEKKTEHIPQIKPLFRPGHPLDFTHTFSGDQLFISISGGNFPYGVELSKDATPVYQQVSLGNQIIVLTLFRKNPGRYSLRITDVDNGVKDEFITIDPPKNPSESDAVRELKVWEQSVKTDNIIALEAYLVAFPNGRYADEAKLKIEDMMSF
jgi:hypothetical protein